MKKKLRKSRKQYSLFKVVFYSNENGTNRSCSSNTCNIKSVCGGQQEGSVNYRCNPPDSTWPDTKNVRCNLMKNC